jgi:hypothetical protein
MRIRFCDTTVWLDTETGRREISPQPALLLRLLLLWPGERVSHDLACHVLNIMRSGIGTYVANLRRELGDNSAVVSKGGYLSLSWDREKTDAIQFRALVTKAAARAGGNTFENLPPDRASDIEELLEQAFTIWRGSPATGLDAAVARQPDPKHALNLATLRDELTELDLVVSDWIEAWTSALLLRSDSRLARGKGNELAKKAIPDLLKLARNPDPPYEVWAKLFAATNRVQDRRRQREAWELCEKSFLENGEDVPAELRSEVSRMDYMTRYKAPAREVLGTTTHTHAVDNDDNRMDLMNLLGITSASALRLRGSRLEPADCIERATHTLYFAGVLAGKWVTEESVFNSLKDLLHRFDTQDYPGQVRFMVLDPTSSAYRRLKQMRGGATDVESVNRLVRLSQRFQCLEIRGIAHLPAFRLIVIDDDIVSFSPYALEGEAYKTSRAGWEAPHVMLDPLAPWPLASAFRHYYEETWRVARSLDEEFK